MSDRETVLHVSARQREDNDCQDNEHHVPPLGVLPTPVMSDYYFEGLTDLLSPGSKILVDDEAVQTKEVKSVELDEKGLMPTVPLPVVTHPVPETSPQGKKRDRSDAELEDKAEAEELLKKQKQEEEAEQQKNQLLNQRLHAITLQLEEQKKELQEQRKISQHLMRVIATKVLETAMPGETFSGPKTGHEVAAFSNNEIENV